MTTPSSPYNRHCTCLPTHQCLTSSVMCTDNANTHTTKGCMQRTLNRRCQATYSVLTSKRSCGAAACPLASCVCWSSAVVVADNAEVCCDTANNALRAAAACAFCVAGGGGWPPTDPAVSARMGIFGRTAPRPDDICAQLDEGAEIRPDDDPTRLSCNIRLAGGRWLPFSDIGDVAES